MCKKTILALISIIFISSVFAIIPQPTVIDLTPDVDENDHIIQFESIDQNSFEAEYPTLNIKAATYFPDGSCGLFAIYNGLQMLTYAEQETIPDLDALTQDNFIAWLTTYNNSFDQWDNSKSKSQDLILGYFNIDDIETIITRIYECDELPKNISIEETDYITDDLNFIEKYVRKNIARFRKKKQPQLIILNIIDPNDESQNHWISIVITTNQTWVMDSIGAKRTHDESVLAIDHLFREQYIPSKKKHISRKHNLVAEQPSDVVDLTQEDQPIKKQCTEAPMTVKKYVDWCNIL